MRHSQSHSICSGFIVVFTSVVTDERRKRRKVGASARHRRFGSGTPATLSIMEVPVRWKVKEA